MKKIWTQIIYRLKKDKGSYISFGVIMLVTALLLNMACVLLFQVDKAYDDKFDRLNAADINFYIPKKQHDSETEKYLQDGLMDIKGVKDIESREAIYINAIVKYFKGEDMDMNTVFYNVSSPRRLNLLEHREKVNEIYEDKNSINIPYFVSDFGEFDTKDTIVYEIGGVKYEYVVSGVIEEMQYGNYGTSIIGAYLSDKAYESFKEKNEDSLVIEYSLLLEDNADIDSIKSDITKLLEDKGIAKLAMGDAVSTKDTRTMVSSLLVLILAVFSLAVLVVSVALCKFRISNSIDEEIVSMGVLKAMGYTGSMIIASIIMPYIMVTVAFVLLGIVFSYAILPTLADVLAVQSGFSFEVSIDLISLMIVLVLLAVVVILFSYRAARKIRGIGAIDAMRSCAGKEKGTKNYLPLETTSGKTSILLVLKQMLASKKQNVLLFAVSFVLAILVAFASMMFYNIVIEPDNFMSTLSEEVPDGIITVKLTGTENKTESTTENNAEKIISSLKADNRVADVLKYATENMEVDGKSVTAFICEDFRRVTNDLCYKGENPKAANEIALGSIFDGEYKIGDVIEIQNKGDGKDNDKDSNKDNSKDKVGKYTVTGFVQSVNYNGTICELTSEGYESLFGESENVTLYVYLTDGVLAESFLKEYKDKFSDDIESTINSAKMQESSQEMFFGIAVILVVVIFVLTMLILMFILYIVIRSIIVQRKQELGIYKAIGYTSRQLILQVSGSFLPVSCIAILLSSLLGIWYLPSINNFIFETIGAMKNNMEISVVFLVIFALVQMGVNFVISYVLAKPVKKISAYSLLKEN